MKKNCFFHVMNAGDVAPSSFVNALNDLLEKYRKVIRITGGCGEMEPQEEEKVINYFRNAFEGFGGVIFSGGTAKYNKENGEKSFMITALPVILAEGNENIKVLGSFPRTDVFRLADGEKGMANLLFDSANLNPEKTHVQMPDANYDELLAVQGNVNTFLDWDGDLEVYFDLMDIWRQGGVKTALIMFNGGGVTLKEARKAVEEGHKLIIINGSGRKADELAKEYTENPDPNVFVAELDQPETGVEAMKWAAMIAE
jgi:hypothetical protein